MKVITSSEAKRLDEATIMKGISEETLMEQAAFAVADVAETFYPFSILSIVGKGNNGGDGIAAARILKNRGYNVEILIIGDPSEGSKGFKKQLEIAEKYEIKIYKYGEEHVDYLYYDLIIDGLIGLGLKGTIEGEMKEVIEKINNSSAKIISIDIPSGIDSDSGEIKGVAVKADQTVTFGALKFGHLLHPGKEYCGQIKIAPLSFDNLFMESLNRDLIEEKMVKKLLPRRPEDSHKYTFGTVLILAGSSKYPGAPILCAIGAQRSGAGLVRLITPGDSSEILSLEPSIIYRSLNKDYFEEKDISTVRSDIEKANVILLGPGMTEKALDFVIKIVENYMDSKLILLDAEAIQILREKSKLNKNCIITPHVGELQKIYKNLKNDILSLEELAKRINTNVVFKSSTTIITNGEKTYFNVEGNTSLAKGGSGDLLSGVIASFMAQGLNPLDAAILGTYIVYKTARDLSIEHTSYYVTPILIANNLYKTFSEIKNR
ncbi:MAG TPA: NAD(P)H-hydrate dehydratase [Defluviitoga sp.]|nr:NAD(P)H-hydrate dehydratase [Defluviitoga sp.]HPZ74484.1 NAD(P)H-hydrate dehydratase [Candidatus Pacearchaeota archaeon]